MSLAGGTASVGVAIGKAPKQLALGPVHRRKAQGSASVVMGKVSPPRLAFELRSPVQDRMRDYVTANRALVAAPVMCEAGAFKGETLALCGAGPSLAEYADRIRGVDQVWACNSALTYLLEQGVNVTGAVGIDQTPVLAREWEQKPDVQYYLASTVDPALTAMLADRRIAWCHNYCGLEDEIALYKAHWPKPAYMMATGHTVVSRAIGLAQWMGFRRIDVYGADCAFGPGDAAHANGEHATEAYNNPLVLTGIVGDRVWRTRPDMLMGAVDLARRTRDSFGTIRLVGDTLPVALLGMSDTTLDRVCRTLAPGELPPEMTDHGQQV